MSKFDTKYFEGERELSPQMISNFGLNPVALMILIKSYGKNISPQPATAAFHLDKGDEIITVEIHLSTPGFVGKVKRVTGGLDNFGIKLLATSYIGALSPRPISFRHMNCLVDIRTKGIPEDLYPNVARDIFNLSL